REGGARLPVAHPALRLVRPAALGQPADRPALAAGRAVPGPLRGRAGGGNAQVLFPVLPRRPDGGSDRHRPGPRHASGHRKIPVTDTAAPARQTSQRPVTAGAWIVLGLAALAVLFCVTATVGKYPLTVSDVVAVLWHGLTADRAAAPQMAATVVLDIRLPRLLAALLVGLALASAGATYQA